MTIYKLDGSLVDTRKAVAHWEESSFWDGRNQISKATNDQFTHEDLYKSSKGRYYIEHSSQWQGSRHYVTECEPEEAAAWLILNEIELPEDLKQFEDDMTE